MTQRAQRAWGDIQCGAEPRLKRSNVNAVVRAYRNCTRCEQIHCLNALLAGDGHVRVTGSGRTAHCHAKIHASGDDGGKAGLGDTDRVGVIAAAGCLRCANGWFYGGETQSREA